MKILTNLISKTPKIALILAIMAALAIHRESFFGVEFNEKVEKQSIANGYGGPVPVVVAIGEDKKIDTVQLGPNDETARFVNHVIESGLLDKWNGMSLEQASNSAIDAVSGATFTSNAIIENVRHQAAVLNSTQPIAASCDGDWIAAQIAIFVVVAFALICYLMPAKTKKLRIPLLIASIGVLGFWQGAFVSVELLYNWVVNGSHIAQMGLIVIVVLAIGMPLLFNKSFYCAYLCPFGAMQELAGKISKKKISVNARTLKIFRRVKQAILVTFVVLIFVVPTFQPSSWEPFTAFIFTSAAISSIAIACVSVVASIFIPRAWCRLLCPTGEIFSLLQRPRK